MTILVCLFWVGNVVFWKAFNFETYVVQDTGSYEREKGGRFAKFEMVPVILGRNAYFRRNWIHGEIGQFNLVGTLLETCDFCVLERKNVFSYR